MVALTYLIIGNILTYAVFWLIQINLSWFAFKLTHSTFLLGLLGFIINFPIPILILAGGVFSDRIPRKHILMLCQLLYLIPNLGLFVLIITGKISYISIILLGMFYGIFFGFAKPAADSTVYDVTSTDRQLKIGVSLNSSTSQIALLFTPFLSSLITRLVGFSSIFILSCAFNLLAFLAFFCLPKPVTTTQAKPLPFFYELRGGIRYLNTHANIAWYIVLVSLALGLIISLQFQFPAIIRQFPSGGKIHLYYFYFCSALGAVSAMFIMLIRQQAKQRAWEILIFALLLQALSIVALSFSHYLLLCYGIVFLLSTFGMIATITGTFAIQKSVANEIRGRILSLLGMSRIGCIPIVSLLLGVIIALLGIFTGLLCFGILYILFILSIHFMRSRLISSQ